MKNQISFKKTEDHLITSFPVRQLTLKLGPLIGGNINPLRVTCGAD